MTPTFGTWSIESSTAKMNMAAAGMLVLGVALALGPDGVEGSGLALSRAAFVLGSLLMVVGTGVLLLGGKQVVIVDTRARRMVLQSKGRFRHTERFIPFDEISQVSVCEHGDSEGRSTRYYVAAKLRSGSEVALFLGFFVGAHSKHTVEAHCQRLAGCLETGRISQ